MPKIKVPKEKRLEFVADYEELGTVAAVARKWGISGTAASYILSLMGVRPENPLEAARRINRRKAGIKDDCLDVLSEKGSYWVGFLTADGCIYHRKGGGQSQIKVALAKKDKEQLSRFVEFFGGRKPRVNSRSEAVVCICSDKLVEVLSHYGVIARKTKSVFYAGQSFHQYENAYLRGLIDGDGCVYRQPNGYLRVGLTTGSEVFVESFLQRMHEMNFSFSSCCRGNFWNLISSGVAAERFCQYLYKSCSICLERKRGIYDQSLH